MSTRTTGKGNNKLPHLLKKLYGDNSRLDTGVSTHIISGLEQNILLIYDEELTDDDVTILCRFLQHKLALKLIQKIQINRTSDRKVLERRIDSALIAKNSKLLKEIYRFIKSSFTLQSITFELVKLPKESFHLFGKALITSRSGKLSIQVLGIEQCGLTDISIPFIASILRAQQNNLDALYWNATLRIDPIKRDALYNASEIDQVYSNGLVALSIAGNNIQCKNDIYTLTRILRNNFWLLGLNISNNKIEKDSLVTLAEELLSNTVIQSILLAGNPGYEANVANIIYESIQENSKLSTSSMSNYHSIGDNLYGKGDVLIADLDKRHADGYRRIQALKSPHIISLLNTWMDLQKQEVFYLNKTHDHHLDTSFSSTMHHSLRSKRYRNKTTSSLNASLDALPPLSIGYSVIDFIVEDLGILQGSNELESPYKRNPKKILNSSINGISETNQDWSTRTSSSFIGFPSDYTKILHSDHDLDFHQKQDLDMYDDEEDDLYSDVEKDVLDLAIPSLSPSHQKINNNTNTIDDNDDSDMNNRDINSSWDDLANHWAEDGGDLLEHMNMDSQHRTSSYSNNNSNNSNGRPPSRISLRPRQNTEQYLSTANNKALEISAGNRKDLNYHEQVGHHNGGSATIVKDINDQIYRKNKNKQKRLAVKLKQYQRNHSSYLEPTFASLNSSKAFTTKRPFVAGSVSIAKQHTNIQTPFEYSRSYSTAIHTTANVNKTSIETFVPQRKNKSSRTIARPLKNDCLVSPSSNSNNYNTSHNLIMGIAQNNGTRIRARSVDQRTSIRTSNFNLPAASVEIHSKDDSHIIMKELSSNVLSATKNLEKVSKKLKDVADSLSSSIELNLSLQKDLSQSILHNNSFNMTSNNYNKNALINGDDDDTLLSPLSKNASQRYDHSRSSPVSFKDSHILEDNDHDDLELVDLIKLRMEEKLRTLLQS